MEKVNVILNGKLTQAIKGETVLQMARREGIEIPTLCHDERLEPFSSCYLCVVEIEGMKGLQPSCSTRVNEGMKIHTDNEKVQQSRKGALDLLLSNHYADCVAPCKLTCPAGVDVQGYVAMVNKGMYREAIEIIKKTNPLPAICGRVCVRPCEVACRRNLVEGVGVGIDYLKRYASDIDLKSENKFKPEAKPLTGKRVAVIGAGPGGLTSAYYLAIEGHEVEVFEASPHAGGMLRYGIPPYRLPNEIIDAEVNNITELGPKINFNVKLGENLSYSELKSNFDSIILTIGSQSGTSIGCEGDDAENVLSGIDFLRNMEMTGNRYDFTGKTVAVIGGGNTAMDCCRTAMRCGAKKVYVIYRRTEKEMPANPIEIHESKLEGIEYMFLTAPSKVNKDKDGKLKTLSCVKMELGEPDASGRRRPVKIEGSEFDVELDIILAAIGQKTVVNFIDDINKYADTDLKLTKWGDVAADKKTLQTSIPNVFAAGDGVTGPATLIEAIAQGRRAAKSCHNLIMGLPMVDDEFEFISRRDNFQKQVKEDYEEIYQHQSREEMPTIDAEARHNFNEVELGYSANAAFNETLRCLECGCTEYYTCDLKKYSTQYKADQNKFAWDYKKFQVDFSHPFIEIDNNKCILCSRCVRICKEVVNANALGLVNRGFETYVAPSLSTSLTETECESCGLCISTCPTAAISENFNFKPGPFLLDTFDTVCNYCSIGCEVTLHHKNDFFVKATGKEGLINKDSNICRFGKFGYRYLNESDRLTKPLLKTERGFMEISFEEAYKIIREKFINAAHDENAVFAGARLTNEEMYLAKRFALEGLITKNITSFQYLNRGNGYKNISDENVPFDQVEKADNIVVFGAELNYENPVLGYMVNNARFRNKAKLTIVTENENNRMVNKADKVFKIKSFYYFIKALNFYYLSHNQENRIFIDDNCEDYEDYINKLMTEDFSHLLKESGVCCEECLIELADDINKIMNTIMIFSEKHLSANAAAELKNLALITGKLGKTNSGIIVLKESANSQGLSDMGIYDDDNVYHLLRNGELKNIMIFGEDPLGCAADVKEIKVMFDKIKFVVVQDYFLTDTAISANLILPASLPFESGGSYSNTQKVIQKFDKQYRVKSGKTNCEQLNDLLKTFGQEVTSYEIDDIFSEAIVKVSSGQKKNGKYKFIHTDIYNPNRIFEYGCDNLVKKFEDEFKQAFEISENSEENLPVLN
jgi:formate dehydrogenase major subunit